MKAGKASVIAVLSCALGACGPSEPGSTHDVRSVSNRALEGSGSTRWARLITGLGTDVAGSVRVNPWDGTVSLLVNFVGPGLDMGGGDSGDGTYAPKTAVGHYRPDGSYVGWTAFLAIPDWDEPVVEDPAITLTSMAFGAQGQAYLAGWLLGYSNLNGPFKSGSFLIKQSPERVRQWVLRVPEPFSAMAVDAGDQVFTAGRGTVRKYSGSGQLLWERTYTASSGAPWVVRSAEVDAEGHLLLGGYVDGERHSPLLARLSPDGDVLWSLDETARTGEVKALAVGPEEQVAVSQELENVGSVVFVASREGASRWWTRLPGGAPSLAFDGGSRLAVAFSEQGAQGSEGVVSLYSREGGTLWTRRFTPRPGTDDSIHPVGVAFQGDGGVVVTGTFSGKVDFGTGPMTSQEVDTFLLALEP